MDHWRYRVTNFLGKIPVDVIAHETGIKASLLHNMCKEAGIAPANKRLWAKCTKLDQGFNDYLAKYTDGQRLSLKMWLYENLKLNVSRSKTSGSVLVRIFRLKPTMKQSGFEYILVLGRSFVMSVNNYF